MFAVAVSASAQGSSGEWSFDSLMGNLASRQSSHVAFREVKRLKVLDSSLTQRGTLIYTSPDTVIRLVEYPKKERFEIKGDQFTYEKDGKKKTVQLNARPAALAFVDAFRSILSGNKELLNKYYRVTYTDLGGEAWEMRLVPREESLGNLVSSFVWRGKGIKINRIEITQKNGDSTSIMLFPIAESQDGKK